MGTQQTKRLNTQIKEERQISEDKDEENKGEITEGHNVVDVHSREREREGMSYSVERERKGSNEEAETEVSVSKLGLRYRFSVTK